ncbi:hypothetical protein ACWGH5_36850 [Streptomyces sp. NPDC054864]
MQATGWNPTRHSCSEVVDGMPPLDSPLVTELIALHAHTRHLGWLSSRETSPEQYRHLARIALRGLLEGCSSRQRDLGVWKTSWLSRRPVPERLCRGRAGSANHMQP